MVKVKKGKDGKRKETRAEKHARLESQKEAREACLKILPYAAGGVLLFVLLFGLYVRSVPAKVKKPRVIPQQATQQGVPEFMNIQVDPKNPNAEQAALDEAMRLLKEREAADPDGVKGEPIVTIVNEDEAAAAAAAEDVVEEI